MAAKTSKASEVLTTIGMAEPDRTSGYTTLQKLHLVKPDLICEGMKGIFGAELSKKPKTDV
jgi:hypothetical protein